MELTCPACHARYRIADDARPADSSTERNAGRQRKARCTACGHVFPVTPTPETTEDPDPRPSDSAPAPGPDEAGRPPPKFGRRWKRRSLVLAPAVVLLGAIALLRPELLKTAIDDLSGIGVPTLQLPAAPVSPLRVDTSSIRRQFDGGRIAFEVKGRIRNPTATTQPVPQIELMLLDELGRPLASWTTRIEARELGPGATADFETVNIDAPPAAIALRARPKPGGIGRF